MPRTKKEIEYPACPICGNPMITEYPINMETFTGRAGWHLDFNPRFSMCHDCSEELLIYINKWFKKCDKVHTLKKFK